MDVDVPKMVAATCSQITGFLFSFRVLLKKAKKAAGKSRASLQTAIIYMSRSLENTFMILIMHQLRTVVPLHRLVTT